MAGGSSRTEAPTWRSRLDGWENRGSTADLGTWRGLLWSVVIAVAVFQLSLPNKLIVSFLPSLAALSALTVIALLTAPRSIRFPRVPWTVVVFLAVCAASVFWSIMWRDTVRMTALYAVMALVASVWAAHTDTQVLLRGVAWGGLLIAAAVAFFVWSDPAVYGAALNSAIPVLGPYANRNSVSFALTLTLPAALMRSPKSVVGWIGIVFTVTAQLFWLAVSPSATGRLGAVVIVAALLVVKILAHLRGAGLILGWSFVTALIVIGLTAAASRWSQIADLLGRTPDLSGRFKLWAAIVDVWRVEPLTGYGFGAVWRYAWLPLGGSRVQKDIAEAAGFDPGQGHNVLFDLLPQLGLLGVVALLLLMGGLAYRGVVRLTRAPDAAGWALLTFVALLIAGATETGLIRPLGWVLVVAASAVVGRIGRPQRSLRR